MSEPIPLYTEREILDVRLDHWPGICDEEDGTLCGCSDPADEDTWVRFTIEHILDVMRANRVINDAMRCIEQEKET